MQAPCVDLILYFFIAFLLFPCALRSQAQDLRDDGNVHKLDATGAVSDHIIPSNTPYTAIRFTLRGGDGGRARANSSGTCSAWGGDGAVVYFTVPIGDGADEIPAGSSIRFVIGKAGDAHQGSDPSTRYAGGGGGTAVLARLPGKTGDTDWIILGVAGGGSGAAARFDLFDGCKKEETGQGGRSFNWERNDDGDGGNAGGSNEEAGGGGGGAYKDGRELTDRGGEAGYPTPEYFSNRPLGPNGGKGGSYEGRDGGWGFGGGGAGGGGGFSAFHGGGGGGYTGGNAANGGGSWVNTTYNSNTTLTAGGASDPTEDGYASYQFLCLISSVTTTPATCGASGSATINVATVCSGDLKYTIRIPGTSMTSSGNTFSGLVAGNYTAYIWRGEYPEGAVDQHEFTIEQGICDPVPPVITLKGDNPIYIGPGGVYSDPGAIATDDIDGDLTNNIRVGGDVVNVNKAGTYTVTYNVKDNAGNAAVQVERTVIVDFSAPVITLNEDNPMYIGPGGAYNEPGAMATDNIDGDLTSNIEIGGVVDVSTAGTYKVTYQVQDQVGNVALEVRTVIVDFTDPVITLKGHNPVYLDPGDTYKEPRARAYDNVDGNITGKIVIGGDDVNVSKEGTYIVTYTVQDQTGNVARKERTVIVGLNGPEITLLGDNPMYIGQGGTYSEPGATAIDESMVTLLIRP